MSQALSPAEVYNILTSQCSDFTTPEKHISYQAKNAFATEFGRELWMHSILNDNGHEIGRLICPTTRSGSNTPHIIYYPGAEKPGKDGVLLADIKKFVDKKIAEDIPDLNLTDVIGHYVLITEKNHYVAGISQHGHLDIQGDGFFDKAHDYTKFQESTCCQSRSYAQIPCKLARPNNAAITLHASILDLKDRDKSSRGKFLQNTYGWLN